MTTDLAFALCLGTGAVLAWLIAGHYIFRPPNHVLHGHQVTVYGNAGILFGLLVLATVAAYLTHQPWVWLLPGAPAFYLAVGAGVTWAMHRIDTWVKGRAEHRRREAMVQREILDLHGEILDLQRQQAELQQDLENLRRQYDGSTEAG